MRRRVAVAVGVLGGAMAVAGLASVLAPGLLAGVPTADGVVTAVGVVAVALGVLGARARRGVPRDARLPVVEERSTARVPGEGFDAALAARDPGVRDRLRDLAVRALVVHGGLDETAARDCIEDGSWTPDGGAAAFFSATVTTDADRALGERVRAAIGARTVDVADQVRRVVDALAAVSTVDLDVVPGATRLDRGPRGSIRSSDGEGARSGSDREHRGVVEADGGLPASRASAGSRRPAGFDTGIDVDPAEPVAVGSFETKRFRGVGSLALATTGVGVVTRQPAVLLAAGVLAAVAAYGRFAVTGDPGRPAVSATRTIADPAPEPGDVVDVTATVDNTGDAPLRDVRFVDGVPRGLAVVDGSPRVATTLAPGETATVEYAVAATVGRHAFEPGSVVVRGASGATERTARVHAEPAADAGAAAVSEPEGVSDGDSASEIVCAYSHVGERARSPLHPQTTEQSGAVPTDAGGEGVEFFGVREYRRGDPQSLVDWKRLARTGELSTVQYREERTVSLVLVVDARDDAYRAPTRTDESAVRRSADAAVAVLDGLLDAGHRVGVSALTPRDVPWLAPGTGREHRVRARDLLGTHPALSPTPPGERYLPSVGETTLLARLPGDAQVVLLSPCTDDYSVTLARRLEARGHATTVLSPDPTTTDSVGAVAARVARAVRLADLRGSGIPVHDWGRGEHLVRAVSRGGGRA